MRRARFLLLAALTGVIAGLGAVFFRALIALVHNGFFYGSFSTVYDANIYTPASQWGAFVILVPVLGGLAVVFLIRAFVPLNGQKPVGDQRGGQHHAIDVAMLRPTGRFPVAGFQPEQFDRLAEPLVAQQGFNP